MLPEIIHFTEEDIQKRVSHAQQLMQEHGLNGMVILAQANLIYYSGFRSVTMWNSVTRPTFLFMPAKGKPIFYTQIFRRADAEILCLACDVEYFSEIFQPPVSQIKDIMHRLNMDRGDIGWEFGLEHRVGCTQNLLMEIKAALPEANFVDCCDIIWKQRLRKDAKEIQCIKAACAATDYAFAHLAPQIKPGMTELDAWRICQIEMLRGGAEYVVCHNVTSSPENYHRGSKIADNDLILPGNMLWFDLTAYFCGYHSDYCRGFIMGEISDERRRLWDMVVAVTQETSEALKPDALCSDVARACSTALAKRGIDSNFEVGRLGHGSGLQATEPPSIMIGDDTVLEPGMVIHIEPGIVNELGNFVCEEMYVITENDRERLSNASRELISIPCD